MACRAVALLLLLGTGGAAAATTATISGTATSCERLLLPPDGVFEVKLQDISRDDAAQVARPDRLLVETYWKLFRCGGAPATAVPGHPEAHIVLKLGGQLVGSGGCNRLTGWYRRDGVAITLGPVATTAVECSPGAEQEGAFLEALRRARSYRIAGEELDLLDADGKVVAEFTAVDLR
ncbi:MAG: META domain-containing protein [Acidobacteria bacterium]|jgi:heat shock protein HslJ|nr:META domain-containing protein [Acidobacteriota bacterium]MCU0254621.1 META domain-containing protein [Acidobacteriota bacterium]